MLLGSQQVARVDLRDRVVVMVLGRLQFERLFLQAPVAHTNMQFGFMRDGAFVAPRGLHEQIARLPELARVKQPHRLLKQFKLRTAFSGLSDGGRLRAA
jgi:hypothetical protein